MVKDNTRVVQIQFFFVHLRRHGGIHVELLEAGRFCLRRHAYVSLTPVQNGEKITNPRLLLLFFFLFFFC